MSRVGYRITQFLRHLWPPPLTPAQRAEVGAVLNPPLAALFWRMTPGEQAHGLRVLQHLQARGHTRPELLQAALLHDVGKTRAPLGLAGRVAVVLAGRLLPGRSAAWGQAAPRGWRRPFVIAAQHPAWGTELCAQASAPPLTVQLVGRHQTPVAALAAPEDELLLALQAADDDQ